MNALLVKFCKLLMCLVVVSLCWACEEDIPGAEDGQSIAGIWTIVSVEESNCTNASDNDFTTFICTELLCATFDFRSDLSFEGISIDNGVTEMVNGTYTVNGNQYSITAGGETASGTFLVSGNNLALSSVDPDTGCDVEATLQKQ